MKSISQLLYRLIVVHVQVSQSIVRLGKVIRQSSPWDMDVENDSLTAQRDHQFCCMNLSL